MHILKRLVRAPALLIAMIVLQVLWLGLTWLTGTTSNWIKIPPLLLCTIVAGLAVLYAPESLRARLGLLAGRLVQNERTALLFLCAVVLIVGVVYATFQVVWTDEGLGTEVAGIVAEKGVAGFFAEYALHPWLASQHPPLMIVIYGLTMHVFGAGLFARRLVCLAFAIATVLVTYFLGRESDGRETGFRAALLLLSFPLFLRLGTAAMGDVPVTFFFALALFLILRLLRKPTYWLAASAGVVIVVGVLVKYTMLLIYPVLLSYFIASSSFRRLWPYLGIVFLVPLCLVSVWLAYAYRIGVLETQVRTLASYATVVVNTDIGKRFLLESLVTRLPSAVGVYSIPAFLLGGWHALRRRSQSDRFFGLWIATVFFLLVLTLPDHRYFMPLFPALALLATRGLERVPTVAGPSIALALFYCAEALYLLVDWQRAHLLFLP